MNIKHTTIAAAVAAALGTSSAFGLGTGATIDITILQSGSSAVQPAIAQVWSDFCVPGTLTTYVSSDGASFFDYSCTLKSVSPIPTSAQGKNLLYLETAAGGSVQGVNPVALSLGKLYNGLAGCASASSGTVTCTTNGDSTAIPDVGISDVEPALFVSPNLPSTFGPLTSSQLGSLHVDSLFQQVFQVAVGNTVHGLGATNITSSQLASVMGGLITDWHSINQAIPVGSKIAVCLRTAGSGTQAGANALFLNNPCAPSGLIGLGTSTNLVFNSSTGNLVKCLDHTLTPASANINPGYELGILGLADGPKAGDAFTTISIDSVAPSIANAATGAYKYNVESTLQYRKSLNTTTAQGALIVSLYKILSTPSSLATVNGGLPAPAYNAEQSSTATPSAPFAASNPVEWGTRGGSTCAPFQLNFPN
jgi:hypothetical protein